MPAMWQRYMMSFSVSMWVAGIATAPILCRATMAYHHSTLLFSISITRSPFSMPMPWKKAAHWSVMFLNAPYVICFTSPWSLVHSNASFSGIISAQASMTS